MAVDYGAPLPVPLGSLGPRPGEEWPSVSLDLDLMPQTLRSQVVEYLSSCPMFLAWMGYTRDVIDDRFGVSGGSAIISDGTYYWRLDAMEYIREYGVAVPEDALSHMRARGWKCPEITPIEYRRIYRQLEFIFGIRD